MSRVLVVTGMMTMRTLRPVSLLGVLRIRRLCRGRRRMPVVAMVVHGEISS
jgi:hypothetical protein